jgi:hypothetical protein
VTQSGSSPASTATNCRRGSGRTDTRYEQEPLVLLAAAEAEHAGADRKGVPTTLMVQSVRPGDQYLAAHRRYAGSQLTLTSERDHGYP